jgi:hypothetical protein
MREDLLARVLGMETAEVAVLAQRGMPTYCWAAARAWCLQGVGARATPNAQNFRESLLAR